MARNVFNDTFGANNDIKVNNFDWSHANNLTTDFGRITPVFCELVPPHSSLKINPRFGLQFMPMCFPVQTRMKARLSFFKIPLRTLWDDYMDYVSNFRPAGEIEEPYIDFSNFKAVEQMLSTSSLGDYLGVPTTFYGAYGSYRQGNTIGYKGSSNGYTPCSALPFNIKDLDGLVSAIRDAQTFQGANINTQGNGKGECGVLYYDDLELETVTGKNTFSFSLYVNPDATAYVDNITDRLRTNAVIALYDAQGNLYHVRKFFDLSTDDLKLSDDKRQVNVNLSIAGWSSAVPNIKTIVFYMLPYSVQTSSSAQPTSLYQPDLPDGNFLYQNCSINKILYRNYKYTEDSLDSLTNPFYSSTSSQKDKQIKLSAYPFRAYEAVYNAYFRDSRNNPFYIDGKVAYNKFIPTKSGGADKNIYTLHNCNWEADFLTTATFTPQQGDPNRPPLVGITTYEKVVQNSDGTTTVQPAVALTDEDGKSYGLEFKTSDVGLEDVQYTPLQDGTIVKQARSLFDLATSGIAIADLRAVNAYQKFLELNMRKSYTYRDIIQGRFNVKVRYDDLQMPEFIGGFTRDVTMNSVYQTVDENSRQGSSRPSYELSLGSQAGIAGVYGSSDNSISVFCDEECIVLGLLTVSPVPIYSQLLPKWMTYRNLLDHYQPEFANLGFQPITYKEVCPVQAYNADPDSLEETFGYQRPWYEYVQKYDTAHGLMRSQLRNFLINRTFEVKPELNQSFLLVDQQQINDVFQVTSISDKIYGQVYFDCTAKLPISRVAIPRLD